MSATTLASFSSFSTGSTASSSEFNTRFTNIRSAVNNHAELIDALNSGSGIVGAIPAINVTSAVYGAAGDGTTDDTAAIQAAIDAITAAGGGLIYLPPGTYKLTSALTLTEVRDIAILGAGRYSTIIRQVTANTPAVQCNGLWYSRFEGIRFETTAAQSGNAVFELDGNYDLTHTLSVQANTFKDCVFAGGNLADYCFAMVRQGTGSGQGSENLFLNCHFEGAVVACYFQAGLNALNNTFIGGNFQSFQKHGISAVGGINVHSVGFQSTYQYTQITNSGFDISLSSSAGDRVVISGCRSESLRFLSSAFSHEAIVSGFTHEPSISDRAVQAYSLNAVVSGVTATGERKMYRCTTAGTTSGAEPTWPASGTVADGTVVWTQTDFDVINVNRGQVSRSYVQLGQITGGPKAEFEGIAFRRKDPISSCFRTGSDAPLIKSCYYESSLNGTMTPIKFGTETALSKVSALNIGEGALSASSGQSNSSFVTIALQRGNGHASITGLNWWELVGGLRLHNLAFADLASVTTANGAVDGILFHITDGTAGDPLTGSGTGCLAYFADDRWKGI